MFHILINSRWGLEHPEVLASPSGHTASILSGKKSLLLPPYIPKWPALDQMVQPAFSPQDLQTLSVKCCQSINFALIWVNATNLQALKFITKIFCLVS